MEEMGEIKHNGGGQDSDESQDEKMQIIVSLKLPIQNQCILWDITIYMYNCLTIDETCSTHLGTSPFCLPSLI